MDYRELKMKTITHQQIPSMKSTNTINTKPVTQASAQAETARVDIASIELRLGVTFYPSSSAGNEIQDSAERTGATLVGGSSESGTLIYKARGANIGAFRAAVEALGLRASIL